MIELDLKIDAHIWSVPGFKANGAHCGLKRKRKDFTIIYSENICEAAAVFTKNKIKAAPLTVSQEHLLDGKIHAIICNSGNANACTGEQGIKDARKMAQIASKELGCFPNDIVVMSTGVIGVMLPMDKVEVAIKKVSGILGDEVGSEAAEGIMTTDTITKEIVIETKIGGKTITLGAVAKGSGMIHPNMATMLSFLVTDANIKHDVLSKALKHSVKKTYNMISVDGDTSTNDTVVILANGLAKNDEIEYGSKEYKMLLDAIDYVNEELAKMIVKDGEGATKMFEVEVINAHTLEDARKVGKSIISSSLVKAAVYGGDPNWGRIMCAAGYSNANIDLKGASKLVLISNGDAITLFEDGMPCDYSEEEAKALMEASFIKFILDLKEGHFSAKAWGCDLTHEYVDINAHYRT